MASVTLSGLASGLDTNSIISQLIAAESRGRTTISNQQVQAQSRITKLTAIQGRLSSLQTATNGLSSVANWLPTQTVESSDAAVATATRTGGAAAGSYTVAVLGLASSSQKTFTYTAPGADTSLTFGSTTVNLTAGASLDDAVGLINGAGGGVVAVNAGGKLVISSTTTGVASNFAWSGSTLALDTERAGTDARYTIDGGAEQTSASNSVTGVMPGVDMTFKRVGSTGVTVGLPGPNADGLVAAMKSWVDAYNSAQELMRSNLSEKPVKGAANNVDLGKGVLFGDSTLQQLSAQLRGIVGSTIGTLSGPVSVMSDLGVTTGAVTGGAAFSQDAVNGKLVFDEAKFRAKLTSDPAAVRAAMGATTGTDGIAQLFNAKLTPAVTSGQGIADRIEQQNATVSRLTKSLAAYDERLSRRQTELKTKFAAMEVALSAAQNTQARLSAQLSTLSGSTSS